MNLENVKGRIFNIQKFSVHDGPGVRTIIFLKGCRLRCRWCCNPESQEYNIQNMMVGGKETVVGKDVTVGEIMEDVLKDKPYFNRSGGGITLSGGEALCQPDFSEALLKYAKNSGITTAVESTGFAPTEDVERLIPYIDYFLMDIKHMDSQKHKEFTTRENDLILKNSKIIAAYPNTKLTIRVPVVPSFNDTVEEISEIASYAKSLKTVEELHLLPYHQMGRDKYEGLGRKYLMGNIYPPTTEKMEILKRTAAKYEIKVQIGG